MDKIDVQPESERKGEKQYSSSHDRQEVRNTIRAGRRWRRKKLIGPT